QREAKRSGAPQIRGRFGSRVCGDPGSAAHHYVLRCAREKQRGSMPLPLDGLLVVSVEQAVAAPQCTGRLADAGARVIKVERPEGDFAREYDHVVHGESANFVWLNRGKQSVVLDLGKSEDKVLLEAMLAK